MHNYTQIKSRKEEMSLSFQSNPNNHVQKLRSITAYKQINLKKKNNQTQIQPENEPQNTGK